MSLMVNDWECEHCGEIFEKWVDSRIKIVTCPKCQGNSYKIITKAPSIELKYNPKTDICDWKGNTSQYYRLYNEAKDRGENVRLPEKGE